MTVDMDYCDRQGCLNPGVELKTLPDGCMAVVCDDHLMYPLATPTTSAGFAHESALPGTYFHQHYLSQIVRVGG